MEQAAFLPEPHEQLELDLPGEVDEFGERWIRTPHDHGRILHEDGKGIVALARRTKDDFYVETRYPVEVAIEVLKHFEGRENVYLSMQRFRTRRRIAQLLSLSSLYVDIDFYTRPELADWNPYAIMETALRNLEWAGIPSPTLAISSGRGLYLVWQHEHLKRSALPRWNRCQEHLVGVLSNLGADSQAKDAARVLRVVGTTRRSKYAGNVESMLPVGEKYAFGELADKILPVTEARLHDLRIQRAMRAARRPEKRPQPPPEGFTKATLWEARLTDLQKLRELRFMDSQMADYRSRWLFLVGVAMGWLAVDLGIYRRELQDLALEACGWHDRKTLSDLGAVIRRTEEAWAGEKVDYDGFKVDPRYRVRNQTIIDMLDIDASEERYMQTIISSDERRRRDRERDEKRRREAGAISREKYLSGAADRRSEALKLSSEGRTKKEIAAALKLHPRTIQRYLRQGGETSPSGCIVSRPYG